MQKNLRKPKNWQDFELLCKKLLGEIWECPNNIKRNGRIGQKQNGVDICAIPKGERDYFGIQCRCKDENLNSELTEDEIDQIVADAINFEPKLKSLFIVSTTTKDSKIEKYVRQKNITSLKNNLFSIELYCWEDIVDLINENPETFRWYVTEYAFKEKYDIDILFENAKTEAIIHPKFKRKIVRYRLALRTGLENILPKNLFPGNYLFQIPHHGTVNKSWIKFAMLVYNSGSKVIENFKLNLEFENNFRGLENTSIKYFRHLDPVSVEKNLVLYGSNQNNTTIVQKDYKAFDLMMLPNYEKCSINIKWHLVARDFDKSGELKLISEPDYIDDISIRNVYEESDLKSDETLFEDVLEHSDGIVL